MSHEPEINVGGEEYVHFAATKIFGSLNGLRAIAILAVLWHHHGNNTVPGWPITAHGFLGVDLFFIISGFLIITLLLRERRQTSTISLRQFYVRRVLRIFPLYYLLLLTVGMVALVNPGGASHGAVTHDLPYAVFFISNLVPMQSLLSITWSLSVEEQFYLVAPTLEKCARRALPWLFPLVYVLVSLPLFGAFPQLQLPSFFKETTFGPILLGVMLAHALDEPTSFSWVFRLVGWRLSPIVAVALVFAAGSYSTEEFVGWPRLMAHWSLALLVASCVVREKNILLPLLSLWPVRRIGIVSYGMYLYHMLVLHFVVKAQIAMGMTQGLGTFIANVLGTWAVAELSYRFFESRFLKLKAHFASNGQHRTPIVASERPAVTGS